MNIFFNEKYYYYLFRLQASGRTNMFGAVPYLVQQLGLDKQTAKEILIDWMNNYEQIAKELDIQI